MFFSRGPRWDPQCCALRAVFGRTPSRSLSPVPLCWCQQDRHSPARKAEAGVSFPTNTVLTPICSVCLIQPLCPTQHSPSPVHILPLCAAPVVCSWIVGVSVPCSLARPSSVPCHMATGFYRVLTKSCRFRAAAPKEYRCGVSQSILNLFLNSSSVPAKASVCSG